MLNFFSNDIYNMFNKNVFQTKNPERIILIPPYTGSYFFSNPCIFPKEMSALVIMKRTV